METGSRLSALLVAATRLRPRRTPRERRATGSMHLQLQLRRSSVTAALRTRARSPPIPLFLLASSTPRSLYLYLVFSPFHPYLFLPPSSPLNPVPRDLLLARGSLFIYPSLLLSLPLSLEPSSLSSGISERAPAPSCPVDAASVFSSSFGRKSFSLYLPPLSPSSHSPTIVSEREPFSPSSCRGRSLVCASSLGRSYTHRRSPLPDITCP